MGGGDRQRGIEREREADFSLGIVHFLVRKESGNGERRLKRSCFGKQHPAWQGVFSGAGLASCVVKQHGAV